MNAIDFFNKVNKECINNFELTIKDTQLLGSVFDLTECLHEWIKAVDNEEIAILFEKVIEQIEVSMINLSYGLYRQAFSSQRLALELFLGSIYFSTNKLEYMEWLNGKYDNSWSKLIDEDNGVLSVRFAKAFCPELTDIVHTFNIQTKGLYRNLSEYVHGNFKTFDQYNPVIIKNDSLIEEYKKTILEFKKILIFLLTTRYIHFLDIGAKDKIHNTTTELHHIDEFRNLFKLIKE